MLYQSPIAKSSLVKVTLTHGVSHSKAEIVFKKVVVTSRKRVGGNDGWVFNGVRDIEKSALQI